MGTIDQLISKVSSKGVEGFAGIWEDEHQFVEAARKTRESGVEGFEAISPFPLHGIEKKQEYHWFW